MSQLPDKHQLASFQWTWREAAGAVADLGVLVPIAASLIVLNGLSPTAVLLPAGVAYVVAGLYYRVPVPVQPLKAFGALAIAHGLGVNAIAAGALLMAALFIPLGVTGALTKVASWVPQPVIRGVQLSVGLLFLKVAWGLVGAPSVAFTDHARPMWWLVGLSAVVLGLTLWGRKFGITLVLIAIAGAAIMVHLDGQLRFGPTAFDRPSFTGTDVWLALTVLVLPQVALTFANSCVAAADVARTYYGDQAQRVTPSKLAVTLGGANIVAGAVGGMPVCHGAGGMTAHRAFGARSGAAPIMMGTALIVVALGVGATLNDAVAGFPLPLLAGLLAAAGVLHLMLVRDVKNPWHMVLVAGIGVAGVLGHLAVALLVGVAIFHATGGWQRWYRRRSKH